ncbi:hypothetical protein L1987_84100 [Smallanthus sonchifolius]|uniref:Uncharacterized protein n=1 Tax=Smallanthus sonchifolius TaxID=185202 RepID=A0ACB8YDP9_9ASTR|nr:hypothetical protein L1987_84100 [Smallanthus sonchifolius]
MVSQMEGGCRVDYNTNISFYLDKGFYGVHKFVLVSMIKLIKLLHRDSIILLLFCGHGNHQCKNGYPNNGRAGGRGGIGGGDMGGGGGGRFKGRGRGRMGGRLRDGGDLQQQ